MPLPASSIDCDQRNASEPLVSIIMPCYNCRTFICEAIESALNQTYDNVEVLVIDDGSTDGSSSIVEQYPVRLLRSDHRGVSTARNLGIRESKGQFLVFLDCDDRLMPTAIASGMDALSKSPECFIAVGAHNHIARSGEWLSTRYKPQHVGDAYELLLRSNFIECTSAVLFRRSIFSQQEGFRDSLRGAEDYELYLRIARVSPVCCHQNIVAEYRIHSSNSSRNSQIMLAHTLNVVSEQWPFARKSIRYVRAYLYGWLFWRRKYGRQLTREMATAEPFLDSYRRAAWWMLVSSYPQGLVMVLVSRMLPRDLVKAMLQRV
jgi:glycosyltransferase involved in cell wall biosynthesis